MSKSAIRLAKNLIKATFAGDSRAKGDVKRQLWRADAGLRQLINGLLEFDGAVVSDELKKSYGDYLKAKELLRAEIERRV